MVINLAHDSHLCVIIYDTARRRHIMNKNGLLHVNRFMLP